MEDDILRGVSTSSGMFAGVFNHQEYTSWSFHSLEVEHGTKMD